MKVRHLIALSLTTCLAMPLAIAQTRTKPVNAKQAVGKAGPAIQQLPDNVFELTELPANHRKGANVAAVLKQAEALDDLSKGEFEKSDEFETRRRTALDNSPLSPSKGPIGLVFDHRLDAIKFNYNADVGQYQIEIISSYHPFCERASRFALPKDSPYTKLCVVGLLDYKERTYNGQNAFGVSAQVEEETGTYVSVAVSDDSRFFKELHNKQYHFQDALAFPVDEAKRYKTSDLKMMLVGRIKDVGVIRGTGKRTKPRLDFLFDVAIDNKGLPFELEGVIYFFQTDGKILAVRDLRETK